MPQRVRKKAKRAAPAGRAVRPARKSQTAPDGDARLRAVIRECDQLKNELARARARIAALEAQGAALEAQRVQVVNRIDWIIDSLHNVLEGEA